MAATRRRYKLTTGELPLAALMASMEAGGGGAGAASGTTSSGTTSSGTGSSGTGAGGRSGRWSTDPIDVSGLNAVNVEVIPLEQAAQGYADFDRGAAKKYVLDPHGMIG